MIVDCVNVEGECRTHCNTDTEEQIFNVHCACDKVCCVHQSRGECQAEFYWEMYNYLNLTTRRSKKFIKQTILH